jgi:hypothetical protein
MVNYGNYIPDVNRFKLAGPPEWWLRALYDFDSSLVVVPSRQNAVYRLAQRRPLRLAEKVTNDVLFKESDTRMLATYSLVPVTTIIATANWSNPLMFDMLRRMAPHRNGGAEATEAKILAQEKQEAIDKAAAQDEMLDYVSKDAWNFYLMKLGVRTRMYSPKTKPPPREGNQAPSIRIK